MAKQKYVMIDDCLPIIFGEYFKHDRFQNQGKITSAGWFSINETDRTVTTFGESVSLGLKPLPGDETIIARVFFDY